MTAVEGSSTNGTYLPEQVGTFSSEASEKSIIPCIVCSSLPPSVSLMYSQIFSEGSVCAAVNTNLHERILNYCLFESSSTALFF